jgi:O-antigen ligase
MIRFAETIEKDAVTDERLPTSNALQACAIILATAAIITSAFHFWPFAENKTWQMLCPPNSAVLVWILILTGYALLKRDRQILTCLPHLSVFAYLSINILSAAFTPDLGRTVTFTAKLALTYIGGYVLFRTAISGKKSLRLIYSAATAAIIISVAWCLIARFGFESDNFGFFKSPYKYGTYSGILVPLCAAYLFTSARYFAKLLAAILVIAALISSGSIGALLAIFIGMATFIVLIRSRLTRTYAISCLGCGIIIIILLGSNPVFAPLWDDIKLAEEDGTNLKQRYIEWQAELNLLEERAVTGTAAGCINEYRSNFYYRLPKLNTLQPFDQNGWLATGAETGILGLVAFCWIIVYHFVLAYRQLAKTDLAAYRFAVANFAGLTASYVANLFSSVNYNGILIVFVLVLALISQTNLILAKGIKSK